MSEAPPEVFFVLGGPGAGKGTQCKRIEDAFRIHHISAGDCLREECSDPASEFGGMIEEHIRQGIIVPVEVTVRLLEKKMRRLGWSNQAFLIDGFPRNANNYEGWEKTLASKATNRGCILFDCPKPELQKRLLRRAERSNRVDDDEEVFAKRFRTFDEETMPIVRLMESQGALYRINADQPIEAVWRDIEKLFQNDFGRRKVEKEKVSDDS